MTPLTRRFVLAGGVVVACGASVMVLQEGVGEHAVWKGAVLALSGLILAATGVFRRHAPPDDRPRIFEPKD